MRRFNQIGRLSSALPGIFTGTELKVSARSVSMTILPRPGEPRGPFASWSSWLSLRHGRRPVTRAIVVGSVHGAAANGPRSVCSGTPGIETKIQARDPVKKEIVVTAAVAVQATGGSRSDIGCCRRGRCSVALAIAIGVPRDVLGCTSREAGSGGNRGRRVGSQISERLGGPKILQASHPGRTRNVEEAGGLPTQRMVVVVGVPGLAEVDGGRPVQATPLRLIVEAGLELRDRGAHLGRSALEDLDLAHLGLALRAVLKTHMVRQRMDGPPLLGGNAGGEDERLPASVSLEDQELGVEAKGRRVVQVDI